MGNISSCVMPATKLATSTTIMLLDGEQRQVKLPAQVAEIMIEEPGHVMARASVVVQTRRVTAIPADEKLRAYELYLLLPANWLGSRLSNEQLEVVLATVAGKKRKKVIRKRVVPFATSDEIDDREEKLNLGFDGEATGLDGKRVSWSRHYWQPKLETICE